jgi:hypothetical protein
MGDAYQSAPSLDDLRARAAGIVAERDRLRAEVAALRAVFPCYDLPNGNYVAVLVEEYGNGTRSLAKGPERSTRDAAIDAAAGLDGKEGSS